VTVLAARFVLLRAVGKRLVSTIGTIVTARRRFLPTELPLS
jgi:hypothetical protein